MENTNIKKTISNRLTIYEEYNNFVEEYHHIFTIIIFFIIIILIIDYFSHILPHSIHLGILIFEIFSYAIFLAVPSIIYILKNRSLKKIIPNCGTCNLDLYKI